MMSHTQRLTENRNIRTRIISQSVFIGIMHAICLRVTAPRPMYSAEHLNFENNAPAPSSSSISCALAILEDGRRQQKRRSTILNRADHDAAPAPSSCSMLMRTEESSDYTSKKVSLAYVLSLALWSLRRRSNILHKCIG